jgi:hypothetical protein
MYTRMIPQPMRQRILLLLIIESSRDCGLRLRMFMFTPRVDCRKRLLEHVPVLRVLTDETTVDPVPVPPIVDAEALE